MAQLGYVLTRNNAKDTQRTNRYYKQDLELMTTFQLREICRKEKIIEGVVNPMDKDDLVRVILRYRGADEYLLIREQNETGLDALQKVLSQVRVHYQSDLRPSCSAKLVAYHGRAIGYYDDLTIKYEQKLAGTNALIVSGNEVCGILNVIAKGDDRDYLYLTKSADIPCRESGVKNYHLYCMDKVNSEIVYRIYSGEHGYMPEHLSVYDVPLLDFTVRELADLNMPLAIDFGTSNTTAGVYLDSLYFERSGMIPGQLGLKSNDVNYALFYDVTQGMGATMLLPTVVGVLSIEEDHPQYLFGYEAVKLANSSYIDEGFCVFYDIKRWIGDYEKSEEIIDKRGRRAFVKRKEIMKAYFDYIIKEARDRFKCKVTKVHISSPVKQKHLFQMLFAELLPEYAVETDDMLDEGVSVLYNTISEMIVQGQTNEKELYKALIIDCGGGTTDLCSCKFRVSDRRVSYKIDIETAYENGDTDFGGNNLTFRVMQILKINLASRFRDIGLKTVDEIISAYDIDVFRYVDDHGPEAMYRELDEEYAKAETVIPTRFKDYETLSREDYYKVKNNFYMLFNTAEQIKKEFFNKSTTLRVALASDPVLDNATTYIPVDKWKLTVDAGKGLVTVKEFPVTYFSIHEINMLLRADIYGVIHRFMEDMYDSGQVEEYSIIKLTGQSCKIDIFRDALKEFVPGKTIKFKRKSGDLTDDFELKMTCIDGALKYLKDRKYGFADVTITSTTPALPYIITAYTHSGREVTLIHGLKRSGVAGNISRNMDDLTLKLYLKDMDLRERYSFTYNCNLGEFKQVSDEDVREIYQGKIPQKDTDDIVDREVKFFVWARPQDWGYVVVPMYRSRESLMMGREQFFSFENDSWVQNFFDGTK